MLKTVKYTLALVLLMGFISACSDNSATKTLKDVNDEQNMDPSIMRDTRSAGAENQTNPEPVFQFKTTEWDFGTITEGVRPTYIFKFVNSGNAELVISGCEASCGCTTPKWTEEPVAPGGTGEIHVAFNSAGKHGLQNKTVTVTANTNPPTTVLKVTGTVVKK